MTHPLLPTAAPLSRPASPPQRLRRTGAMLVLAAAVGLAGLGCSKTDQVATDQSTTAPPATAPDTATAAGDASGAPRGTGSTVATPPGTIAITTSTTAKGASTTATTGAGPSTTMTTDVAPTTPQPSSTVAGTAADAAFCAKAGEIQEKLKNIDPTGDPAATMAQYKQVFADLTAAAPPEIQADMNQINQIIQSMTSFDSEPPEADKLEAAGKRVDDWAVAHCGKSISG